MRLKYVSSDVSAAKTKVAKANRSALWVVAENVLSDCRRYVPVRTGALRDSGATEVSKDGAYVKWGTDEATARYARTQYLQPMSHTDPRTSDHWFERARAERESAWGRMYAREAGRLTHG